jgi:hypothetical protein
MGQETDLEIYKQRYETYRHLDRQQWQMLQIVVAVGSAAVLTLRATSGQVEWWFLAVIGMFLLLLSSVMLRMGAGIRANGKVLHEVGQRIGDAWIPDVSKRSRSRSLWIASVVALLGFVCIAYAAVVLII